MVIPVAVFAAALACSAVEVERIFRPERLTRGDTNVRVLQPIDEAAWIWAADNPGWARDTTDTWTVKVEGEPSEFRRFRCDFPSDGSDLTIDVSADERFVLLLDGTAIARRRRPCGHQAQPIRRTREGLDALPVAVS